MRPARFSTYSFRPGRPGILREGSAAAPAHLTVAVHDGDAGVVTAGLDSEHGQSPDARADRRAPRARPERSGDATGPQAAVQRKHWVLEHSYPGVRIDPNCIRVFHMKKNLRACRFYYVNFSI